MGLIFDIRSIDKSGDPETAMTICADVQEVSNELVKNDGRLLIIDNDCHGSNKLFGNLDSLDDDDPGYNWATKLSTKYCLDRDNFIFADIPDKNLIQMEVPKIDTGHRWRRLM